MKRTCYGSILCRPSRRRCSIFALLTHQTDIPGLPLWFFSKLGCKGPCSQQKLQMYFSGDRNGSWSFQCLPEIPRHPLRTTVSVSKFVIDTCLHANRGINLNRNFVDFFQKSDPPVNQQTFYLPAFPSAYRGPDLVAYLALSSVFSAAPERPF